MQAHRPAWYQTAFAAHYPLLYQHRDEAEARRCVDLLPQLAPLGTGPILDLGCGAGRHLELLAARGEEVLGLDLSRELLALAAARARAGGGEFRLLRADMRALPVASSAVSSVLSLFTAFGYFGGLEDNAGMVDEIVRILKPGGHWFLDYFNAEAVAAELAGAGSEAPRQRELGPLRVSEQRRLLDQPQRVAKQVRLQPLPGREVEAAAWGVSGDGLEYQEEVALFSLADLDALLATRGMTRVAAAGDYDGQRLDLAGSPRWLLVYRKAGDGAEGDPS